VDEPVENNSQGLQDLARVIETIIGKASVTLQNLIIKWVPRKMMAGKECLSFLIESIALLDHVNERNRIPDRILHNDDILSHIIKYVQFDSLSVELNQRSILRIPQIWIRVTLLHGIEPSLDNLVDAAVADLNCITLINDIRLVLSINDLLYMQEFIEPPKIENFKDNSEQEDANSETKSHFNVIVDSLQIAILQHNDETDKSIRDSFFNGETETIELLGCSHFLVSLKDLNIHVPLGNPNVIYSTVQVDIGSISVLEFDTITNSYYKVFSKSKVPNEDDYFHLRAVKLSPKLEEPWKFFATTPNILLNLNYSRISNWVGYNFNRDSKGDDKKPPKLGFELIIPQLRILFDFDDPNVSISVCDFKGLCFSFSPSNIGSKKEFTVEFEGVYFGFKTEKDVSIKHFIACHNCDLFMSFNSNVLNHDGLTESFHNFKHRSARELVNNRENSGWSDIGENENSGISSERISSPVIPLQSVLLQFTLAYRSIIKCKFDKGKFKFYSVWSFSDGP
jgi:hypothetical protein